MRCPFCPHPWMPVGSLWREHVARAHGVAALAEACQGMPDNGFKTREVVV